jgi:hypothetical protein
MAAQTARRNRKRSPEEPETRSVQESADLGASIAENAVRLAQLYLERARMSGSAGDGEKAGRDKSRAELLYQWADEAAETTTSAGQDVLYAALDRLKEQLDSLEVAKGAGAS